MTKGGLSAGLLYLIKEDKLCIQAIRMKGYESVPKTKLMKRTPVAIRVDGKAFHTFTKGFKKPFDEIFSQAMQAAMKYMCEEIQGCVIGYTQSDEITLVLVDYKEFDTQAWLDYRTDKVCSIAASMATMKFNRVFRDMVDEAYHKEFRSRGLDYLNNFQTEEEYDEAVAVLDAEYECYYKVAGRATFDARCWNVPKEEVANMLYWRQLDAITNSKLAVGQANFSHSQLHKKSCKDIVRMLKEEKGIDWDVLPITQQRGSCCIRNYLVSRPWGNTMACPEAGEHDWFIDNEIPVFKGDGREYVERLVEVQ